MIEVQLKKGKEKSLLRRHPWVYDTAVGRVAGKPDSGETVKVTAADGRFLGYGAYSPKSTLRVRMWSFDEAENTEVPEFLRARLEKAVKAREGLLARTSARRIVFGEADGIPGLIVDQYGDWLVTQFQSAGTERRRDEIVADLMAMTGAKGLFDRSDAATRQREGLAVHTGVLAGEEPPELIEVAEDGVKYGVNVRLGHKTGFYVDQRESRLAAQQLARDFEKTHGRKMRALNCFCYTGGFSLALALGGAAEVVSVDSSAEALAQAKRNADLNGFTEAQMKIETARCLDCGTAVVDESLCVGCGVCTTKCKFDAIRLEKVTDYVGAPYFQALLGAVGNAPGAVAKLVVKKIAKP